LERKFFNQTPLNTNYTGGTVTDISILSHEDDSDRLSYILSFKELTTFPGFEQVKIEEAQNIIDSLYQLSIVAYTLIHNE
jgi:hypothetical protein